ncbi:MAG: sulfite exporter TauE/SafE family protein, partial [Pseudomonadota bacterium]
LFSLMSLLVMPPRLPDRYDKPVQLVAGALAGVFGGFTAIWSPPMVMYMLARRLDKDEFVRASGLLILLGSIPLTAGFWQQGLLTGSLAITSAVMIVPTLIGFSLGEIVRDRLPADRFRSIVLLIFLLMGLNLVRRALV